MRFSMLPVPCLLILWLKCKFLFVCSRLESRVSCSTAPSSWIVRLKCKFLFACSRLESREFLIFRPCVCIGAPVLAVPIATSLRYCQYPHKIQYLSFDLLWGLRSRLCASILMILVGAPVSLLNVRVRSIILGPHKILSLL